MAIPPPSALPWAQQPQPWALLFRPVFLNLIDDIILFRALSKEDLFKVVDLQIKTLKKRLAERNIEIEVTQPAKEKLVEEGYDPVLGARPLKRVIQKRIQNVLALKILRGEIKDGAPVTVTIDQSGELAFETDQTEERQAIHQESGDSKH